jgi:hypothetical protein
MAREADPNKEPIQSKKKGSMLMTLFAVIIFAAAAGLAYFYVIHGRPPTTKELSDAATNLKDKASDLANKAKDMTKGGPVELMTTSNQKVTTVAVTLKKESVDEYKSKYSHVQVVIPQLDFNEKAPKSSWPVIGRKDIIEYHPIKIEEVDLTVNGIEEGTGKVVELYKQSKK